MSGIDIPGFTLIEKIGAGGMATVWKARQLSLDREVAIKILYSKFANDPNDVARFQTEAQSAARLKHPGIVQVYDANVLNGMYYFVMEYVAGYTVGEWIKRKGVLPLKDSLLVAECVVDALEYAWNEAGIIHCDVKPDNVLVDADGSVKVSDLGLARTLSQMLRDEAAEDILGTPAYISPEQALGESTLDFRADVYSLGAMLYHMVSGRVPFAGNPPEEIMDLQVSATIPDPIDVNPELTGPVCWLIEKMMCKDPAGRQASWAAVRQDIERVKLGLRPHGEALPAGLSTVERSPARSSKTQAPVEGMWKPRGPGVLRQLVNLALLLTVAGAAFYTYLHWKERESLLRATPPPAVPAEVPPAVPAAVPVDRQWEVDYQNALDWITAHPGRYEDGIGMLARVAQGAAGSSLAAKAQVRLDALVAERARRIDEVIRELDRVAGPLVATGRREDAARVYHEYAGALASETAAVRAAKGDACLAGIGAPEPEAKPAAAAVDVDTVLDGVARQVLNGEWQPAHAAVHELLEQGGEGLSRESLEALAVDLEGALAAEARVFASFEEQKGKAISVQLRSGRRDLRVQDVRDGLVFTEVIRTPDDRLSPATLEFGLDMLSFRERLERMGPDAYPGMHLMRGVLARKAGATDSARQFFGRGPPILRDRLLADVQ
jgi:eukaryotic-like serine/threonine-protein kinase